MATITWEGQLSVVRLATYCSRKGASQASISLAARSSLPMPTSCLGRHPPVGRSGHRFKYPHSGSEVDETYGFVISVQDDFS